MPKSITKPGDRLPDILVFQTSRVSICLAVENKGKKRITLAKAGFKSDYCTVPVMEHVSRSCSIVMHQPLINFIKGAGRKGLYFTFLSDSICSLRLLKEDIYNTYKLGFNTRLQLENFIVLNK